jgi:hypothetical protein
MYYLHSSRPLTVSGSSEAERLVSDSRAGFGPAEFVEQKLIRLLRHSTVPLSSVRAADLRRNASSKNGR